MKMYDSVGYTTKKTRFTISGTSAHHSVIHEALVESELSARYDVEDRMLCLSLRWGRRDVLRHACIYVALGGRVSIYGLRSLGRV